MGVFPHEVASGRPGGDAQLAGEGVLLKRKFDGNDVALRVKRKLEVKMAHK